MERYDPLRAPDPGEWLDLGEQERIALVARYHRKAGIRLPNPQLHALMHVIAENQVALGEAPVRAALDRLLEEGLDRHDALHAVGSVLAEHMHAVVTGSANESWTESYYQELERLTAKGWLGADWTGGRQMVELRDKETKRPVGTITEQQLQFLIDRLEEESPSDRDYYLNPDTIDLLAEEGADPGLVEVLRQALGDREEAEIEW